MPNPSGHSSNNGKKTRLGRGLGSLLGGGQDFDSSNEDQTPLPSEITKSAKLDVQSETRALAKNLASQKLSGQNLETQLPSDVTTPPQKVNEETQIWTISIDRLRPNTQQPRQVFANETLKDLTASIKEQGILQPITARRLGEREFEIIAGERRWRAAQAAGLHEVPVILKNVSEQASLELAIIENIQREDLNPMDEAEAIEHLAKTYHLTQQQIAEKLGKDRSSIANSLRLLSLPRELRESVRTLELSTGHAKVLMGLDDLGAQVRLAKQVINEKLSVRATEKLVVKAKAEARGDAVSSGSSGEASGTQRLIQSLAAELQKLIGTKVSIDYAGGKGKMSVHFYSDDQLTQVVEKFRKSWEK